MENGLNLVKIAGAAYDELVRQANGMDFREPTVYKGVGYIGLPNGSLAVFDSEDLPKVQHQKKWYNSNGYPSYSEYSNGKTHTVKLHQLVVPSDKLVDHISGIRLDNRSENLREVTYKENNANRSSVIGSTSKYKGVTFDKSRNKWLAQIEIDGKCKHLGRYAQEREAARAYNEKAKQLYGEYARLNNVEGG